MPIVPTTVLPMHSAPAKARAAFTALGKPADRRYSWATLEDHVNEGHVCFALRVYLAGMRAVGEALAASW